MNVCTFAADSADASVEILETDHAQTTGIQEPRKILHLKQITLHPQLNDHTSASNKRQTQKRTLPKTQREKKEEEVVEDET